MNDEEQDENDNFSVMRREISTFGFELKLNQRLIDKSKKLTKTQIDRMKLHALSQNNRYFLF